METKIASSFWWVKNDNKPRIDDETVVIPKLDLDVSSSLADFLEKERNVQSNSNREDFTDMDVGSIIEEINRVAAQSPLGPYEKSAGDRSVDDIMKEAERIYLESSRSFDQLSQRSKTSLNVTDLKSKDSTPTPISISPLPTDDNEDNGRIDSSSSSSESYSEDFSQGSVPSFRDEDVEKVVEEKLSIQANSPDKITNKKITEECLDLKIDSSIEDQDQVEIAKKDEIIRKLENDNCDLKKNINYVRSELEDTKLLLQQTQISLDKASKAKPVIVKSPEINLELERTLEQLKDSREINTGLQLQLDTVNKTHILLKNSYEDLLTSNKNLERKVVELDLTLTKYKNELISLQSHRDKLLENEISLSKLLEIEKLQSKSLKLQNEKDARCIQDLNRQIKEMERIIARKHPDSVSALIVAAKSDATDSNLTARRLLEDRIKALEEEAANRDLQSSKVFMDIQEKFNQMKIKYESHIEDLELHVSDLKDQLKRTRTNSYDVYTQTMDEEKVPHKDTLTVSTQTDLIETKNTARTINNKNNKNENNQDAHLLATIRGLKIDLSNKEKAVGKLQREIDELKKTNRRLQKEREGSLRSLTDKREFRSYPEKLATQANKSNVLEEELRSSRIERDKIKEQLCRMENDYRNLKEKRLQDLSTLQEAHESELAAYMSNVAPLREQLELQKMSLTSLQDQLRTAREELTMITIERDHLNNQIGSTCDGSKSDDVHSLHKKIAFLEKRYEERELRLRAILHGLAQKNVTNGNCDQCSLRQKQLMEYKTELDQLLVTVRALK